jgi:two-component system NtrC family sensor kinase
MTSKISHKLIIGVVGVAIVIIGVFAWVILDSQQQLLLGDLERSANQLSATIKSSTRDDMMLNRPEAVHRIISTIGAQEGIEKVRIFNKEGRIILSTDARDTGQMVDKRTEACYMCHTADQPLERVPVSERVRTFRTGDGPGTFGIIDPIYNEPGCWQSSCHAHSENQTVLGVLDITMSMAEVERAARTGQVRLLTFALIAVAATSLMIYWLVGRIVLQPVRKIVAVTRKVADGDLSQQVEVRNKDEIGTLAASFNDMMQKLADAQRQLLQANKLASVGRLAAGVAHEINNPLTGVLTYSSFLLKRASKDSELREDLEVIVRETKRCREIVKGLLDFSRQSVSEPRPMQINEIVRDACRVVKNPLSMQKTKIDQKLEEELPLINADANRMEQVLVNLLVNAGDAMEAAGGTITVTTDLVKNADLLAGSEGSADAARIRVSDAGCGIEAKDLDKIFEPFFSTKGTRGNGLGLAIVWGIIERHGGRLTVDSEVGKGTTFTILLPLAKPLEAESRNRPLP